MAVPYPKSQGINQKQRRLLRAGIRALCLEENYRDILQAQAGVSSSKDLSLEGFQAVMDYLQAQGFSYSGPGKGTYAGYLSEWSAKVGNRPGMATAGQLALIETIWDRLAWYWNKTGRGNRHAALTGFLLARFGCENLRFVSFDRALGVIEALKSMEKRKK